MSPLAVPALPLKVELPALSAAPFPGAVIVTAGASVSTIQDACAGDASVAPVGLTARTCKLCEPWPRREYVAPLLHGSHGPPSKAQRNELFAMLDLKENRAEVLSLHADSLEVIVVLG